MTVPLRLFATSRYDLAQRRCDYRVLDGRCDLYKVQIEVIADPIEPTTFDETARQDEMPASKHCHHAQHVGPALLAPDVVSLDCREQPPRSGEQRPPPDAGHPPLEFRLDRRRLPLHTRDGCRAALVAAVAHVHADRL